MSMHIESGPALVLAAGTVTGFGGHPVRLALDVGDGQVTVALVWEEDDADPAVGVRTEWEEEGLRLVLVNFDTAEGRGSARPVLLAERDADLVFFHFRVFRYGQTDDRTVHYTFYRVSKEAVGWAPG